MAQDKIKKTMTDPMLEGTGQPGELADTPVVPSAMQDPALVGTGQPGELVGTPTIPDSSFVKESREQKALNKQRIKVGSRFVLEDIFYDLNLMVKEFKGGK